MLAQPAANFNRQDAAQPDHADDDRSPTPAAESRQWINLDALHHARAMIARSDDMPPTDKLVLLGVAMRANGQTGAAWMAAGTLGADLGLHRSAVLRSLRSLTARGALEIDRRNQPGRGKSHTYRLSNCQPVIDAEKRADCALSLTTDDEKSAQSARDRAQSARQPNVLKTKTRREEKATITEGGEGERRAQPIAAPARTEELPRPLTPEQSEIADALSKVGVITADRIARRDGITIEYVSGWIQEFERDPKFGPGLLVTKIENNVPLPQKYCQRDYMTDLRTLAANGHADAASLVTASTAAETPDHADDARSPATSNPTPAQGDAFDQTLERIKTERAATPPTASTAAGQPTPADDARSPVTSMTPAPDHTDDQVTPAAISPTPTASTAAQPTPAGAATLQAAFDRALIDGRPHMTAARILRGARCTNSEPPDTYTATLPAHATAADLDLLNMHRRSIDSVFGSLDDALGTPPHRWRVALSAQTDMIESGISEN